MPKRKIASAKPAEPRPWVKPALLLAALALAVYANSLGNGFIGDDKQQLLQNPVVSAHRFGAAFTSGVWAFQGAHTNYYRPLQFVVYALVHAVSGFQPFAFHLLMALLHALNTVGVFLLATRLGGRTRAAWAAAALFALHPIHTEAVDWVASLPDVMLTAIVIFAIWNFATSGGKIRGPRIALHAALYAAALLTKETGVMLLPLYLGYEWIVLGRRARELRSNMGLYAALVATFFGYLAARWAALGGLAPAQQTFHHLTPTAFALSVVVTAAQYAGKLILPLGLNYFHIFQPVQSITPLFLISLAVLAAIANLAFRRGTPAPLRYGLFWMAVTLAPALNLTGVGQNVFAERYLYLPSVALAWVAGLAWDWCAARRPGPAYAAGIAILCLAAWETLQRNPDWSDDFTLLQKTVSQSPSAGILHNNLAGAFVERNDLPHALEQEQLAVRLEPRSTAFHKNLGLLLMAVDPRAAASEFEAALRLQPGAADLEELLREARAASK